MKRREGRIALLGCFALALIIHATYLARLQGESCIDDAYISFRYARNLNAGHGLVFNPGERVEGYTNFGWVLLMAAVDSVGLDMPSTARIISMLCGGTLVLIALWFLQKRAPKQLFATALAGGLLVTSGPLVRWSQDGLETVLFSLLVLVGVIASFKELETASAPFPWSSLVFSVATLVRPEGALFFVTSIGMRALFHPWGRTTYKHVGLMLLVYSSIVAPHIVWRWSYYGHLLPNTFHAKVGTTVAQAARGARYVGAFFGDHHWPLLILVPFALWRSPDRKSPSWHRHLLVYSGVYLLYVAAVGGDWMGSGRFIVPVYALICISLSGTAAATLGRWHFSQPIKVAGVAGSVLLVASLFYSSAYSSEHRDVARQRTFLESRHIVATWLRENAHPRDRLLAGEIGQLAYHSGLPTDDLFGLTDPVIANMDVPTMGLGKAGHEKSSLDYSLSKRPTWIVIPGLSQTLARGAEVPGLAGYELRTVPGPIPRPGYGLVLELRRRGADEAGENAPRTHQR